MDMVLSGVADSHPVEGSGGMTPTKTAIDSQVVSTTIVGKGIGEQCILGGMGEFVVLYGIVGIIRMERPSQPGVEKKNNVMVMGNGENTCKSCIRLG